MSRLHPNPQHNHFQAVTALVLLVALFFSFLATVAVAAPSPRSLHKLSATGAGRQRDSTRNAAVYEQALRRAKLRARTQHKKRTQEAASQNLNSFPSSSIHTADTDKQEDQSQSQSQSLRTPQNNNQQL